VSGDEGEEPIAELAPEAPPASVPAPTPGSNGSPPEGIAGDAERLVARSHREALADWLGVSGERLEHVPHDVLAALVERLAVSDHVGPVDTELVDRLRQLIRELVARADTDPVTGIATRRAVVDRLGVELDRCQRYGRVVSAIILEVRAAEPAGRAQRRDLTHRHGRGTAPIDAGHGHRPNNWVLTPTGAYV
jgi:hypothetical protein